MQIVALVFIRCCHQGGLQQLLCSCTESILREFQVFCIYFFLPLKWFFFVSLKLGPLTYKSGEKIMKSNYYVYMYRCIEPVYNIDLNTAIYRQQSISSFTRVSTKPTNPATCMYMEKDHLRLLRNFWNLCRIIWTRRHQNWRTC